jgi:hypothetical protein
MSQHACCFRTKFALTVVGLFLVVLANMVWAQTAPVRVPNPTPGHPAATPKQEPCWQVAGISKSAMDERRSIEQGVRSQVEAVCADSSLTAQQRAEKIREIHQQAKQQIDALITPQQMEELRSCQQSRSHGGGTHPSAPHAGGAGHGPCGELPASPNPGGQGGASKPEPTPEKDN